jgi:glycosyltransferase involved in cell wall biosynthesis
MRVAVVTTSYPTSDDDPSGHFVQTEARLIAREAEVHVVTAAGGGAGDASARSEAGVQVWRLGGGDAFGWPGVAARVAERPWRLVGAARWTARARRLLQAQPAFDRVVCHWAVPCAFPVAVGAAGELEVVSHGGDVRLLVRLPAAARRLVVGRILGRASSWTFVSTSLHDTLAAALDEPQRRRLAAVTRIRPAAIDLPDVRTKVRDLRAGCDGRPLVVCVGRLVESKRFHRAFDHVAQHGMAGTRVVVVGDGPEKGRLEAHARRLGLDTRFVGRTSRADALAWIAAADSLLHASRDEGLSTVVREAEALGVPVEVVG